MSATRGSGSAPWGAPRHPTEAGLPRAVDANDRLAERGDLELAERRAVARRDDGDHAARVADRVEPFPIGRESERVELAIVFLPNPGSERRGVDDSDPVVRGCVDARPVEREDGPAGDVALCLRDREEELAEGGERARIGPAGRALHGTTKRQLARVHR